MFSGCWCRLHSPVELWGLLGSPSLLSPLHTSQHRQLLEALLGSAAGFLGSYPTLQNRDQAVHNALCSPNTPP